MMLETEIVDLFTRLLEQITFTIDELEFDGVQLGKSIFIIDFIGKNEPCSLKDIYENTAFPASTTSRRVDDLVKDGFVKRSRSENDRRSIVLELTKKGRDVFSFFWDHRIATMERFLDSFSKREIQSFVKVLRIIVEEKGQIFIL